MKTPLLALALAVGFTLVPDDASARSNGRSSHGYRVVSGGHRHSGHGIAIRPSYTANRYPRFYPTTSRSNFIVPTYTSSYPVGYRVVRSRGGSYPRYYYGSHVGYIGRPYIHVGFGQIGYGQIGYGRPGCHPYTHHYHHDDWRFSRGFHD